MTSQPNDRGNAAGKTSKAGRATERADEVTEAAAGGETTQKRSRRARSKGPEGRTGSPPPESSGEAGATDDGKAASTEDASTEIASRRSIVVGVGASAGGLDALKQLLSAMPADTGMAFVLIPHLDPTHESMMASLLSKHTRMPIVELEGRTRIEPNHVYMIPPNKYIELDDDRLTLTEAVKTRGIRMPIDYFFRSLAASRAEQSVCIVLSGTGTDGTQGLKEVKAAGGLTLAQQPNTAAYDGMPRSAVGSGMVDYVLPIEDMPEFITRYAQHPYAVTGGDPAICESTLDAIHSILELLRLHTDYDFRCYKKGTVNRRIQRRMGLRHVVDPAEYLELLRNEPAELRALFKDLLIGVTRFFREKEAWDTLEAHVVEPLLASKQREEPVRVWVPGCSTGEEVYSLAIVLHEHREKRRMINPIQIFGTDLDKDSIEAARAGLYPASIAADVRPDRLERYFIEERDELRVTKRLRESCIFAVQNLVSDPPFSNLDLVSCRNLLIYLEADVQTKLMRMFHFALRDGAYLFLGSSESTAPRQDLFEALSQPQRIYRRLDTRPDGRVTFPISAVPSITGRYRSRTSREEHEQHRPQEAGEIANRVLIERFAPPSVLIDPVYNVRYVHGEVRDFLSVPAGEPTSNLLAMVPNRVRGRLRGLVRQLVDEEGPVSVEVDLDRAGETVSVRLTAQRVNVPGSTDLLLVSFETLATAARTPTQQSGETDEDDDDRPAREHARQLEYELQAVREDLQGTIEELETSNEELKASNAEVMSMNEELQSSNEELETSREELQSLNQELSTVNSQLEEKIDELEDTNNDLNNLLTSTEIATIFLDTSFRIRLFTPSCETLLRIIPGDQGRPISDLAPRFNDSNLLDDSRAVLRNLSPVERQVLDDDGTTFIRRILPYRTAENSIEGVIITFTDVTELAQARQQLEVRARQQSAIAALGRAALRAAAPEEICHQAAVLLRETLDIELAKVLRLRRHHNDLLLLSGTGWQEGIVGDATVDPGEASQAGYSLQVGHPVVVEDLPNETRFTGPDLLLNHGVISGMSVIIGDASNPWGVLGAHSTRARQFSDDDVSFLQAIATVLYEALMSREHQRLIEVIAENSTQALIMMDRDGICTYCNSVWLEMTGFDADEIRSKPLHDLVHHHHPDGSPFPMEDCPIDRALPLSEVLRHHEDTFFRKDGTSFPVLCAATPILENGEPVSTVLEVRDMTTIRTAAEALKESEERLRLAKSAAEFGIYDFDPRSGRITTDDQLRRLWGFDQDQVVDYDQLVTCIHPDDLPLNEQAMHRAFDPSGDHEYHAEYRVINRTFGEVRWISAIGDVIFEGEEPVRLIGVIQDITDRKVAELELASWTEHLEERVAERTAVAERRAADLRQLASQITHAEQRARRRVARAIHDDLQQLLVAAKMRLPAKAGSLTSEEIKTISSLLDDSLATARNLVRDLSPPVLQHGSLATTLSWLARRVDEQHDLKVNVQCEFDGPEDHALTVLVFECVRELLFNIVKHARVDEAVVEAVRRDGELFVVVSDEGEGFDPAIAAEQKDGFGLFSVRERIEAFGGTLEVSSAPGDDARFTMLVPLPDVEAETAELPERPAASRAADVVHLPSSDKVRVVVVDDHAIVREGLCKIIDVEPDIEIVGQASDGYEAIAQVIRTQPDVVIMDVTMPRMNGIAATRSIVERSPDVVVIGLSLHDSDDIGDAMRRAGAAAYIQKDAASTQLTSEIRRHVQRRSNG